MNWIILIVAGLCEVGFTYCLGRAKSVEESLEIINTVFNSDHVWALVLKETGQLIGCMGYYDHNESNIGIAEGEAEVGYWIGKVMEKCGFRDTGDINWLSELYKGDERPVKIMRLDYSL